MSLTHTCPRQGCMNIVPNSLFACRDCWHMLSPTVKAAIYATARLSILDPARRGAFALAKQDWDLYPKS